MAALGVYETATAQRSLSRGLVRRLAGELSSLRGELLSELNVDSTSALSKGWRSLSASLDREVPPAEAADSIAQTIVCAGVLLRSSETALAACREWFLEQAAPWEQFLLEEASAASSPAAVDADGASWHSLIHLYEQLLRHDQPDRRKRAGVFYTPQPIVRYMLRQIDTQLREEFGLPLGLADGTSWGQMRHRNPSLDVPRGADDADPFVRLFDPAVGTGAFLLDAIDFIHARLTETWKRDGIDDAAIDDRWNQYVPRQLLPRLWGMELLPAPCFFARLHVALKLAQTGYRFGEPARIEIHLGNTLAGPSPPLFVGRDSVACHARRGAAAYDFPFTVVLGNPPFSYLSVNQSDWITSLIRGEDGHSGYLQADGQKLGEKKTWLHDDYVKFVRYAQWRIETTGCGIAALVTNHGYLTNATFRIMRQQLLKAFPRISILDLHGNRKAREVPPDGCHDKNVFGLDQGIAIGFFRRPLTKTTPRVEHAELWGSRTTKFERLSVGQVFNLSYVPAAPDFRFVPSVGGTPPEYSAAPSLADLLPLHASAPVTARDHFVVAFSRQELRQRIENFKDSSIPDEEIRRLYFARTRSPRYTSGDTRSWKLADARRVIAAEPNWESYIQRCQYRPLDWRWIFWHPAMIDWPRADVTQHFRSGPTQAASQVTECEGVRLCGNRAAHLSILSHPHTLAPSHPVALIARRQIPPSEPCTYFWVTSALTLDGIIRNDNRGSESLFPCGVSSPACRNDNLVPPLTDSSHLACYAYALWHSPTYRLRYAAVLRSDFPRVLMPKEEGLAAALARIGRQLIAVHTQRPVGNEFASRTSQRLLVAVAPRFPQFVDGRIWIRDDYSIAAADEAIWQFCVGAHQVARKWLADRRGRPLTEADLAWYGVILDAISQTRQLMVEVDAAIVAHGGFPQAFLDARADGRV